ncbi:putative transcription factor bHLH30 [Iris pallida]|uniref:Transcription factor bHLH30 n=1 Tax=Iris pallida TaxID=29817 RepID=A0AAX6DYW8_IRIPA|nr:putative transcription factor bHLH30 [Iris pallida]
MDNHGVGGDGFMFPSEFPALASWPLSSSMINPTTMPDVSSTAFFSSLPPSFSSASASPHPSSIYGDQFYSRRANSSAMQFSDAGGGQSAVVDHLGLGGLYMPPPPPLSSMSPFGSLHAELISKMTAQEIMDAKALAASKSHSEAERRRRERINAHLAKLRSLLPSTTKTDKASLLAEVIQHVKELKRQTSEMAEDSPLPTEVDELTLDTANENGKFIIKASLCCDDRSDLIPDLAKALKSLRLRTLKAEITTLGGRVKNIVVVTGEDDDGSPEQHQQSIVSSIQDALRAVMERTAAGSDTSQSAAAGGGIKRQRTNNLSTIVQQRSSF